MKQSVMPNGDGRPVHSTMLSGPERMQKDTSADMEIGHRIRYLRTSICNIPRQLDFANELGVSRGAVGNWELGKGVSRENLQRMANRFHISFEWLASGKGQPRSAPDLQSRMALLPPDEYERFYADMDALLTARLSQLQQAKPKG